MDTNGLPMEGFPSTELPLGLGAIPPLPADMSAGLAPGVASVAAAADDVTNLPQTTSLTEAEKEQLLFIHKDAKLR